MRRRLHNPKPETARPARVEPLAEGLAKRVKRRRWRRMSDDELVAHARGFIAGCEITGRAELEKADRGLYSALRERQLLDRVGLGVKLRDWTGMGNNVLVSYAKRIIAERGITGRMELEKADKGVYSALRGRQLLDRVGLGVKLRDWTGMGNNVLVSYAKRIIAEKGVDGRKKLAKADRGLYSALRERQLLDRVGLGVKLRDWTGMGNNVLVSYAKRIIAERGITGRMELEKADSGLYKALRKWKLLDDVGLPNTNSNHRNWAGMGKEELVAYARKFIEERGITGRKGLEKADTGQYSILRKRKLLDAVFSEAESSKHSDAIDGVIDALESFGDGE